MNNKVKLLYEDNLTKLYQGDCRDLDFAQWEIGTVITGFPYVAQRTVELDLLNTMAPRLQKYLVPGGIFVNTNTDLRKDVKIRLRHFDIIYAFLNVDMSLYDYRIWDKEMGHNLYRIGFSHILAFHTDFRPRIKRSQVTDDILVGKALMFGKYHDANSQSVFRKLIEIYSEEGDTIYDPFVGSGTLLLEARSLGRKSVGIELDEGIAELARTRLVQVSGKF